MIIPLLCMTPIYHEEESMNLVPEEFMNMKLLSCVKWQIMVA